MGFSVTKWCFGVKGLFGGRKGMFGGRKEVFRVEQVCFRCEKGCGGIMGCLVCKWSALGCLWANRGVWE